jgi:hypothetical protein
MLFDDFNYELFSMVDYLDLYFEVVEPNAPDRAKVYADVELAAW